jgi:CheY-like chemotaxis protein
MSDSESKGTILLVDDEHTILTTSKMMLEALGYTVTAASDAAKAIEAYKDGDQKFDMIVSDLSMPDMDGLEFMSAVRELGYDGPSAIVSGYALEESEYSPLFSCCLTKPFRIAALQSTIENFIS